MNGAQHSVVIDGHTHIFTKDRKGNNGIVYKVYENTVDGTFRLMSQVQLPDGSIRWVWCVQQRWRDCSILPVRQPHSCALLCLQGERIQRDSQPGLLERQGEFPAHASVHQSS